MKEAVLYKKTNDATLQCGLCSHYCIIKDGEFGFCGVRKNLNGILYAYSYAKPVAMNIDPIEKKPLYHFLPGSLSFSIATAGCNFRCGFCQNWQISQSFPDIDYKEYSPEYIVKEALSNKCRSISYTYTEPTIFFEYALDIAKLAKEKGLYNIFVTNGYMTKEALFMIRPYLDAANVDLKFFNDTSYKKICSGSLEPVLDSIRLMKEMGIWVEITTLLIPGENDSIDELKKTADFISGVDKRMPWHISRFHPDFKFTDYPVTSERTLKSAYKIGEKAGLEFIYIGNTWGFGNDTNCPSCKRLLIKRQGFSVVENNIKEQKCQYCNAVIDGHFV